MEEDDAQPDELPIPVFEKGPSNGATSTRVRVAAGALALCVAVGPPVLALGGCRVSLDQCEIPDPLPLNELLRSASNTASGTTLTATSVIVNGFLHQSVTNSGGSNQA